MTYPSEFLSCSVLTVVVKSVMCICTPRARERKREREIRGGSAMGKAWLLAFRLFFCLFIQSLARSVRLVV